MAIAVNGNAGATAAAAVPSAAADPASPATVSAGLSGGAAYLSSLLALGTTAAAGGSSGLPTPTNPEDAEALLLLVESNLDKATSANRAAGLAARFGTAQGMITAAGAALAGAQADLTGKEAKLATDQNRLTADQAKQADLQTQSDAVDQTISTLRQEIQSAPGGSDTSALQTQLTAALALKDDLDAQTVAANAAVAQDTAAVSSDTNEVKTAETAVQQTATEVTAALSRIATGLRRDVAADSDRAADVATRRDIAYDDTADIAKRQRDGEVDRAAEDATRRAGEAERHDQDRGTELATQYAAAVASALATLRGFVAAPPPAVSPTAAAEVAGRVRLSL